MAAVLLSGSAARAADPREQQLAQALFDEARQLMEAKRFGEACPKLAESQRLDPGGGTLLNLAICHEKEGRLATAQAELNDALSLAMRDGRKERQAIARERLAAIETKVPRVMVVVPHDADVEGLEVRLDGLVLRRAAWGVATPVDPGPHRVEASAPGHENYGESISVEPGERKNVSVPALAPLKTLPPPSPAPLSPPLAAAPQPLPAAASATTPASSSWAKPRPNPWFYGAIGLIAAGTVTAGVTGTLALIANVNAKTGCNFDRHYCKDQASLDAADRARTMAWVSTGSLAAAAVGVAALFFVKPYVRPSTEVGVAPLPGGGELRLRAQF